MKIDMIIFKCHQDQRIKRETKRSKKSDDGSG